MKKGQIHKLPSHDVKYYTVLHKLLVGTCKLTANETRMIHEVIEDQYQTKLLSNSKLANLHYCVDSLVLRHGARELNFLKFIETA